MRFREQKFIATAMDYGFDEVQARFMWMFLFCEKEKFANALLSEEVRDDR